VSVGVGMDEEKIHTHITVTFSICEILSLLNDKDRI
jgi:hypothetical protein